MMMICHASGAIGIFVPDLLLKRLTGNNMTNSISELCRAAHLHRDFSTGVVGRPDAVEASGPHLTRFWIAADSATAL